MITPKEATRLIAEHVRLTAIEALPLARCTGAVLREEVRAERDQPPFDRVTMDGIALDSAARRGGLERYIVQATQAAGDAPLALASPRHCIEIMTGAMLPAGCDLVVPVEQLTLADGVATLHRDVRAEAWGNVHRRGTDARAGTPLLRAGIRLSAPEIAAAAGAGASSLQVSAQPRLAVISTGNELVEPGQPILAHQVRRSNAYGLIAALHARGLIDVVDDHLADDAQVLRRRLAHHLETRDVLVLSGGVSAGKLDLVPGVLAELGVQRVFHKVAQRPGKPMWFGVAPSGALVFALPGNPVATLVCLARYVAPALRAAMGESPREALATPLAAPVEVKPALAYFMPVRERYLANGQRLAEPCPTHGSGDFVALAGTDGFVELPPGPCTYPAGFVVPFYGW